MCVCAFRCVYKDVYKFEQRGGGWYCVIVQTKWVCLQIDDDDYDVVLKQDGLNLLVEVDFLILYILRLTE